MLKRTRVGMLIQARAVCVARLLPPACAQSRWSHRSSAMADPKKEWWIDSDDDDEEDRLYWKCAECPLHDSCSERSWEKAYCVSLESEEHCRELVKKHLLTSGLHQKEGQKVTEEEAEELARNVAVITLETETHEDRKEYRKNVRAQKANSNQWNNSNSWNYSNNWNNCQHWKRPRQPDHPPNGPIKPGKKNRSPEPVDPGELESLKKQLEDVQSQLLDQQQQQQHLPQPQQQPDAMQPAQPGQPHQLSTSPFTIVPFGASPSDPFAASSQGSPLVVGSTITVGNAKTLHISLGRVHKSIESCRRALKATARQFEDELQIVEDAREALGAFVREAGSR